MKSNYIFTLSILLLTSLSLFADESRKENFANPFLQSNDLISQGFLYVQGSVPEEELDANNIQVKIGCWNICGTHLSQIYGGVPHWQYRIPGILEKIRTSNPDIMIFKEIYDPEVTDLLIEGLKDRYAHLFVHLGPNPDGLESGCMVLSKYPIHKFTNTSFKNNASFLNRGFATLEIKASPKDTHPCLRIIGTHILFGYDAIEKRKREDQIQQIKKHLHSLISCPTLIAADFNTEREDESLSFLEHGYQGKAATCMTTPLIQQWDPSAKGPEEEWIDNISLVKGSKGTIRVHLIQAFNPESLNAKTALSDHHFLIGEYSATQTQ